MPIHYKKKITHTHSTTTTGSICYTFYFSLDVGAFPVRMPGGSRLVRASHGPSRQVTIPQVLSALYGPSICTLRTLLLRLLTVPSELGPQAANPLFLNAEGQGNADWVSPPAGSNQTLYSELLNDIRSSALFPNSANSADRNPQSSEQVDHADEVLCVTKAAEIAGTLVRDADPEDYVNLLDKTLVALRDGAPQSVNFEFEQRWTQKEVIILATTHSNQSILVGSLEYFAAVHHLLRDNWCAAVHHQRS